MVKIGIILLSIIVLQNCVISDKITPKVWNDQWEAEFDEEISIPIFGSDNVTGK